MQIYNCYRKEKKNIIARAKANPKKMMRFSLLGVFHPGFPQISQLKFEEVSNLVCLTHPGSYTFEKHDIIYKKCCWFSDPPFQNP